MANVIAIGNEMENGQWTLYDNGTIVFQGGGMLKGQGYRLYQQQIKRIEVHGFTDIGSNQFERLPNLEEIVIGRYVFDIYHEAFYGCHKLRSVIYLDDEDPPTIWDDAFAQTPYGGDWTEEDSMRLSITEDFWKEMARCLSTLKQPYQNSSQLLPAMELLKSGAEAGSPELMYLWAEFLHWGYPELKWNYGSGYANTVQKLADDSMYEQDCRDWYIRSAKAGYAPAICWLGWTALQGIGRKPDPEEAQQWFDLAEDLEIFSLEPEGIDLFVETASKLEDDAYWADIDEDDHCCDEYWMRPDSTWRDLHGSALAVYELGRMFGSARCGLPEKERLVYGSLYSRDGSMDTLVLEKRLWQIWCAREGPLWASPAEIEDWFADCLRVRELGGYYESKLDQLMDELGERVVRLRVL